MDLVSLFQSALENLNYGWIFLLMTIESSFIPFPSEVVVIPAAFMAAEGNLSVPLVVLFATLGGLCGATINYLLAYFLGRPIVYAFADSKIGHLCLLDSEKVKYAEDFFVRHGILATLTGRLIPAVRQLISIPAGLAKMNFGKFALFTAIGACSWNLVLILIGLGFHEIMDKETLIAKVQHYSHEFLVCLIILCVVVVGWLVYKNWKRNKDLEQV